MEDPGVKLTMLIALIADLQKKTYCTQMLHPCSVKVNMQKTHISQTLKTLQIPLIEISILGGF